MTTHLPTVAHPDTAATAAADATAAAPDTDGRCRRLRRVAVVSLGTVAVVLAGSRAAEAAPASNGTSAPTVSITGTAGAKTALGVAVRYTAHASRKLDGSTYFLRLTDATTHTVLAQCSHGASCSTSVRPAHTGSHVITAHLDSGRGGPAPYPVVASAQAVTDWVVPQLTFSTPELAGAGAGVALVARTDVSLTGSKYFLRLKSATKALVSCGSGELCRRTVSHSGAFTGHYSAHLDLRATTAAGLHPVVASLSRTVRWLTSETWTVEGELNANNVSLDGGALRLSRDGAWRLVGHAHDSSTFYGDYYSFGCELDDLGHGAAHSGELGAEYSGPAVDEDIADHGNDPWITRHWAQIVGDTAHCRLSQSDDLGSALSELWGELKPYAGEAITALAAG